MRAVVIAIWAGLLVMVGVSGAATREGDWERVKEARSKDQPKTEIKLLEAIETAALVEEDWDAAARAMAQRIATEGRIEGPATVIKKLDAELEKAPEQVKPVLRALAAGWMHGYYNENRWRFMQRSSTGVPSGDDMETWDLARILTEVDKRMQLALADDAMLKSIPVGDFSELLQDAELGDEWQPTMFDFVAQRALDFYGGEEVAVSRPTDAFEVEADSPVFGTPDEFLAWKPETEDKESPIFRALVIHRNLLAFHQKDEKRDAFLLADLVRLRWAKGVSVGDAKDEQAERALEVFIERNAGNPVSAWAREDLGEMLEEQKRTKEAFAVFKAGAEAFPEHDFGKFCRNGINRLEKRELNLSTQSHWTPAGEEIRVTHRNLNRVWFRLYSMAFKPGNTTISNDPIPDQKKWLPAMLKGNPVREWDSALVDEEDYAQRNGWLKTPKDLPNGYHVLVASADEDFSLSDNSLDVVGVHITSMAMTVGGGNDGVLEGQVLDAVTGAPLAGVEVGAWVQSKKLIHNQETRTDESGYFRFKKQHNGRHLVVASRGVERAVARIWSGSGRTRKEEDSTMVVFFTDRSIYRPGQTVHFKGIFTVKNQERSKYEVIAERKAEVVFLDPNRKEAARVNVVSNERGSFSGTFSAPEGSVLGQCWINVPGVHGGARIRVEEYKRPKFFTEVDAPKEAAALGQEVKVKVRAEAYTGAPVDGAKVAWRVTRTSRLPVWARWCWWVPPMSSNTEEIAHGISETSADGSVEITFDAKADKSVAEDVEPVFDFEVVADVTDGAGETRSATRRVSVAYTSLKASMLADEWLEAGKDLELKVRTESHDGEGRSAKGTVKIHRLKEPDVCPIPESGGRGYPQLGEGDDRPSVDPDRWEPGEVVEEMAVETNDEGQAHIKPVLEAGAYRLVFETKDANGRKVQALLGIEVVAPEADDFPTMVPFFTGSPNWTVEPGNSVSLLWGSGHKQARACVEWYQGQKLLKREWSTEGRTQQLFSYPIEEKQRGGITVIVRQVTMNRLHQFRRVVSVPWTNKELKLRWEHLVSKLDPGAKETWTAVIEGVDGEAAVAEMVATMYDASLDAFAPHAFQTLAGILRREGGHYGGWQFGSRMSHFHRRASFDPIKIHTVGRMFRDYHDELQVYSGWMRRGYGGGATFGRRYAGRDNLDFFSDSAAPSDGLMADEAVMEGMPMAAKPMAKVSLGRGVRSGDGGITRNSINSILNNPGGGGGAQQSVAVDQVVARKNLQETAFFYPDLTSDEDGRVRMTFTMPEALTKWRFLGMAHDADFRSGLLEGETVTAKDLMVQPNPPRFLREGDVLEFTVKVTNQSDEERSGTARLSLADATSDEDRTAAMGVNRPDQVFTVPAKESRTLRWRMKVPVGAGFLKYKAVAASGDLTDGEEGWLPVIPRRILVTESMSLPIRNAGTKEFEFTKLLESGASETLEDRFLHVQVVSQPAWYAVMALPYLMEFPHECSEQTFNRYYANALARHIAGSDPKMRRIFDLWKAGGEALDSPLMKNADLKGILLEETSWLREAKSESEARRRVGLLFDDNHMDRELEKALRKLSEMQGGDGLWPWFPGGRGSNYISLYVTTGFARLRALGVETDITPALKALKPLDAELSERYEKLRRDKNLDQMNLTPWVAHHLYTRTFFLKDKVLNQRDKVAFDYFAGQARKHWVKLNSRMSRAHVALALHRLGDKDVPQLVTRSLKENAKVTEEQGMFWKDSEGEGWWWWQAPIETQAMMIESFREVDADAQAVDDCQVWLIKQKQVGDWKTTKATADAVYSLLMGGRNLLGSDALLKISLGGAEVKPEKVEAGTGFYESRFVEDAVRPELGNIELTKSDEGVSWASVHWQYLEDMSKVTSHEGKQLNLDRELFVRKNTDKGPVLMPLDGPVDVGDELVTRVILRNDRAMEFIHLKDLRGSGTEPVNVLSGYRWQDGFGYYEVTRDTASHFFIDRLPPGTHVFETSVRVQHAGEYQTGIAEVRCMYAPEFAAHSASVGIKAE